MALATQTQRAPVTAPPAAPPAPVQRRADPLADPLAAKAQPKAPVQPKAQAQPAPRPKAGGLTYDAEGAEGGRYHSRVAHWPGGASGVTIGRGYDLGSRTAKGIVADMTLAGIPEDVALKFAAAAGIKGKEARLWLNEHASGLPEISPAQQLALFDIAYKRLAKDVERISSAYAKTVAKRDGKNEADLQIDWGSLHPAIKDMLVDLRYRGDYTPATRKFVQPLAIANDLKGLCEVMNNRGLWAAVPPDRFARRARFMNEAVAGKPKVKLQDNGPLDITPMVPGQVLTGAAKNGAKEATKAAQVPLDPSVAGKKFGVTADVLNVRGGPGAANPKLGSVQRGATLEAKGSALGWLKVVYGAADGWVSQQFVAPGTAPAPIKKQDAPVTVSSGAILSGANWPGLATSRGWYNALEYDKLAPTFGPKIKKFVEGLRKNGVGVTVSAGLRHKKRAVLMHCAWHVQHGTKTADAANALCQAEGITDIQWNHGSVEASQKAAGAMSKAFGLKAAASLTSNHMGGEAMDLSITNVPAALEVDGKKYTAGPKGAGVLDEDKVDHIGKDLGVIWYGSGDYVHWSLTGR